MKVKILIVRFSSIGDIVLTTPIIRCLKLQLPNSEIHYLTKTVFKTVLENNPYIDNLFTINKDISEVIQDLKKQNFNFVIDLHHNLRTLKLKRKLRVKSFSFNKLNIQKFKAVYFKSIQSLPKMHIVDRYFETVKSLGVTNDNVGLDYFIAKGDEFNISDAFKQLNSIDYIALVIGGSYYTKQIPLNKLIEICNSTKKQCILLGSEADNTIGLEIIKQCSNVINACGLLSLNKSAYVIKMAESVVTSDTGLMHIAAAFNKPIFSFWGNTLPEFGMSPVNPNPLNKIFEVKDLNCRPCSKLGFHKCPKGHFKCMNEISLKELSL